jgi:hypothetical protein
MIYKNQIKAILERVKSELRFVPAKVRSENKITLFPIDKYGMQYQDSAYQKMQAIVDQIVKWVDIRKEARDAAPKTFALSHIQELMTTDKEMERPSCLVYYPSLFGNTKIPDAFIQSAINTFRSLTKGTYISFHPYAEKALAFYIHDWLVIFYLRLCLGLEKFDISSTEGVEPDTQQDPEDGGDADGERGEADGEAGDATNIEDEHTGDDIEKELEELEAAVRLDGVALPSTPVAAGGASKTEPPFPADSTDKPFAFVSYSHADEARVYPIINRLHDEGIRLWYDEGIDPSTHWRDVIARSIIKCTVFLSFISPNIISKDEDKPTFPEKELELAIDEGKKVISIFLEETTLSPGLKLEVPNRQALMPYQMTGDRFHEKLSSSLKQLLHVQ